MRIERYFHIRQPGSIRGGATVLAAAEVGSDVVYVNVAYCSYNDQFSRKVGRVVARTSAKTIKLPLAELPKKLERVAHQVVRHDKTVSRSKRQDTLLWNTDFGFSTRYFEPKKVEGNVKRQSKAAVE